MLAMNYMYEGQREFGLELARKVWHNLVCTRGYTWDMPNIMRGDVDTGERTYGNDYYQEENAVQTTRKHNIHFYCQGKDNTVLHLILSSADLTYYYIFIF
jgi:hypothetical protein